jgi:chaperonin GroEL
MHKLGVLDPLKVVRTSLESAASVAGLLLTTDSVLVLKEEADLNPQPMMAVPQQQ